MTPARSRFTWRKSSYSGQQGGDCVEVCDGIPGVVPVRDSKEPARGHLMVSASSWTSLARALKAS
ncbi:DUF397 domain-containing protein [Yinghuangia seranimata]|uniref:DUF397 domain-containing protein n=1 Tax=Yinghuangia seranimata TaxID=408067 RepID=UPI00248CB3FA|nr:DUF397 domain-containing protein [Yinghuangia seranimata]MDI2131856.1 DUF397 domain-containing protein [Yinghuangia seranimata]